MGKWTILIFLHDIRNNVFVHSFNLFQIMFYLFFISFLTLLGNLISDLLYAAVDPRVRLS